MRYIQVQDRNQITLLPDCIEDYIEEDNPVRVIDAFVNSLHKNFSPKWIKKIKLNQMH